MFKIKVGSDLVVSYARKGKKKDGTPYAVVAFVEKDNQAKELENPSNSKSIVKCWMESLPDDVVDGSVVKLTQLGGFDWVHTKSEAYGKTVYRDEIVLVDAMFTLVK